MATSNTFNISDLLGTRNVSIARKQVMEARKSEPVMYMIVKRQAGNSLHRQLFLATTERINVYQEAALVHAFPLAVSSDRVAIDPMAGKTRSELDTIAKNEGIGSGRFFYWLANVDGMEPAMVKKLGDNAKSICLNAILYLHAATEQMLAEMTAPDDGDVPTRKVVIRDAEAEVEVEAEELFVG